MHINYLKGINITMSEINEILNLLYYVDEDLKIVINNSENEKNNLKKVLRKLDYVYSQVSKLENK